MHVHITAFAMQTAVSLQLHSNYLCKSKLNIIYAFRGILSRGGFCRVAIINYITGKFYILDFSVEATFALSKIFTVPMLLAYTPRFYCINLKVFLLIFGKLTFSLFENEWEWQNILPIPTRKSYCLSMYHKFQSEFSSFVFRDPSFFRFIFFQIQPKSQKRSQGFIMHHHCSENNLGSCEINVLEINYLGLK